MKGSSGNTHKVSSECLKGITEIKQIGKIMTIKFLIFQARFKKSVKSNPKANKAIFRHLIIKLLKTKNKEKKSYK